MPANGGRRPVPDPTSLTTQQLLREIYSLREIMEARADGDEKVITQLQARVERIPGDVDLRVDHLQELHSEKFGAIQIQFRERDVAVTAALQSAKEAVGEQNKSSALAIAKSEAAVTKQIDQLMLLMQTTTKAIEDKIGDIKERQATGDGKGVGQEAQRSLSQNTTGYQVAAIIGILSILVAVGSLIVAILRSR